MPSAQEVEKMIEQRVGVPITWTDEKSSPRHMKLKGTGTLNQSLDFRIDCYVSYPPLKVGCTITFAL